MQKVSAMLHNAIANQELPESVQVLRYCPEIALAVQKVLLSDSFNNKKIDVFCLAYATNFVIVLLAQSFVACAIVLVRCFLSTVTQSNMLCALQITDICND